MANIFNKKFEDISFRDIDDLVQNKVPESQVLDYKLSFEKRETTKLICALANTYGGFIIYGIKTDSGTNLPELIEGISDNKLDDTIDSICFDAITEPVTAYLCRYIENDDKSKRLFLIRVFESDMTPHAVDNNTTVYVKVMSQKRPILDKAKVNQLTWLVDRRQKAATLRERLIQEARSRAAECGAVASKRDMRMEIAVYPVYPKAALIPYSEVSTYASTKLSAFAREMNLIVSPLHAKNLDQGFCEFREQNGLKYYVEFNTLGVYSISVIVPWYGEPEADRVFIQANNFGLNLFSFLNLGVRLLSGLNYAGSIGASVWVSGINPTRLLSEGMEDALPKTAYDRKNDLVSELSYSSTFSQGTSDEFVHALMIEVCGRFVHLFGLPYGADRFADILALRTLRTFGLEFDEQKHQFVAN